ncbi:uncharacterized protein EKO05_0008685 [Ascochyta rabiei]|uniref:uncharacterized protein n=1 Tax=Didymella rabiei TaxID=5454 RepID=UPI0022080CA8|nr:uncharacterized protein EKO05_0008685 [Ascochyta rabiei]UPX18383.1 hypothetical protein EKO05_0008685 [Ascochyta rabiei]
MFRVVGLGGIPCAVISANRQPFVLCRTALCRYLSTCAQALTADGYLKLYWRYCRCALDQMRHGSSQVCCRRCSLTRLRLGMPAFLRCDHRAVYQ